MKLNRIILFYFIPLMKLNSCMHLHDTDDGATKLREIAQPGDDAGGIQETLAISCEPGEEAHDGHRRRVDEPDDGSPDE